MTRGRVSFFVFLLILALPVLALNFGNLNVIGWISEQTKDITARIPVSADVVEKEPEPVDPFQWLNDRPALRDTFITNEMTDARFVTVKKIVTTEDLLAAGEVPPKESLLELYAAARAPAHIATYCANVIASIGLSCDVTRTLTHQNRDGDWIMDGRLAFLPAAEIGDPSSVENGQLLIAEALLPYTGDLRPPNDAPTRTAMLNQAQAVCDKLKERLGNCVLTSVTFELDVLWITDLEVLAADTNPERIEAKAGFAVYADPMMFDGSSFADLVEEVANQG